MTIQSNARSLHHAAVVIVFLLASLILTIAPAWAQSLIKVPFPYSPINASALPFFVAKDMKIYERYGLDVDPVDASPAPPMSPVLAGRPS
jgi:ABC-type nitrate/sulfonate/bicarbonate transport system substrate-binding protein